MAEEDLTSLISLKGKAILSTLVKKFRSEYAQLWVHDFNYIQERSFLYVAFFVSLYELLFFCYTVKPWF